MRKSTKAVSMFLAVLMLFSVFPTSVFAVGVNGSGAATSGDGYDAAGAEFNYPAGNYPVAGYRFSVIDGTGKTISSPNAIDVIGLNDKGPAEFIYNHYQRSVTKYNKKQLIDLYNKNGASKMPFNTTFNKTDTYMFGVKGSSYNTTFSGAEVFPSKTSNGSLDTAKMKTWAADDDNLKPFLQKLGYTNGVSSLPYNARVLIEPLCRVVMWHTYQCVTPSELASLGLNRYANGISGWGESTFKNISSYTNMVFPNTLYTDSDKGLTNDDGTKLWSSVKILGSETSHRNVLTNGYGVNVAYTSTYNKPTKVSVVANTQYSTTWSTANVSTGKFTDSTVSVSLSTSSTSLTNAVALTYNSSSQSFVKEGVTAGKTYYVWASLSSDNKDQKVYTGVNFYLSASEEKTVDINYYRMNMYLSNSYIDSMTVKFTAPHSAANRSYTATSTNMPATYFLKGTKINCSATLKAADTYTYSLDKFLVTAFTTGNTAPGTTNPWDDPYSISFTGSVTAFGKATLNTWNATFKTNGGKWHDTGNTNDEVIAYKVNDSVVPGTDRGYLVKDYYHFKSWKVTAADNTSWGTVNSAQYWNTSDPTNSKFTVKKSTDKYTGNVTLTAQWELNKLHVSYWTESSGTTVGSGYKLSGGEIHTSSGSRYYDTTPYDTSLTLKTAANFGLSRTGYSFGGWKMYYWDSVDRAGHSINSTIYTSLKPSTVTTALKNYKTNHYNKLHGNIDIKTGEVYVYMVAVWSKDTATLKVNPNKGKWTSGGTTYTSTATFTKDCGTTMTISDPTRTGYTFTGWTRNPNPLNGTFVSGTYKFSTTRNKTDTLTANWDPNVIHVSFWTPQYSKSSSSVFKLKDTSTSGSSIYWLNTTDLFYAEFTYEELSTKLEMPPATDYGLTRNNGDAKYHFVNWSVYLTTKTGSIDLGIKLNPGAEFQMKTILAEVIKHKNEAKYNVDIEAGDVWGIYFVANWALDTYTVEYYLDGVKQTSLTQTCSSGTSYTYKNVPTKTGYKVNNDEGKWCDNASSYTGNKYAQGASFSNLTTNGGVVKRYAYSTPRIFTITCDKQSGTGGTSTFYEKYATGYYSDAAAATKITKITVPTRTGYTFGGYYTKTGGNGTLVVDASGNIKTANTFFTANTTIYAKWTPKIFTITCDRQGGTGGTATFYEKYANGYYSNATATTAITKITVPTRANYTFKGYYTQTGGKGTLVIDTAGNIKTGNTFFTADTTIYAYWVANVYKITCDKQGGTGGTDLFYEKYATGYYSDADATKAITKITVPTKNGYAFGGYYTQTGGKGTLVVDASGNIKTANTFFTANTTIYAKWTPYTVKVTYRTANANASVSSSYKLTPLSSGSSVSRIFTSKDELVTTSSSYNNSFKLTAPGTFGLKRTKLHFVGWTLCFTTSSGSVVVQNDGKDVVLDPTKSYTPLQITNYLKNCSAVTASTNTKNYDIYKGNVEVYVVARWEENVAQVQFKIDDLAWTHYADNEGSYNTSNVVTNKLVPELRDASGNVYKLTDPSKTSYWKSSALANGTYDIYAAWSSLSTQKYKVGTIKVAVSVAGNYKKRRPSMRSHLCF